MTTPPDSAGPDNQELVTLVVRTHIKPGRQEEYEVWLHGINEEVQRFKRFQGVTILRPESTGHAHPEYVAVVRFASYDDLRRWEASPEYAEWINRLQPLALEEVVFNNLTGMEGWFTLPGHKVGVPPPKYKMAVVGMFGASPFVLLIIPLLVAYLSAVVPPVLVSLILLLLMSSVMTWVTMPLTTRMLRRWLYPTA